MSRSTKSTNRRQAITRKFAVMLAVLLAVGTLSTINASKADAATMTRNRWGYVTVRFTKWETKSFGIVGAAFAASKGVPWGYAVAAERFADYAADRGYCLQIGYYPPYAAAGFQVWYYRC